MLEKLFYKKQVILMYIYPLFDPVESAEHDLNVGEDEHVADDLGSISSIFYVHFFANILSSIKSQSQNVAGEKLHKALLCKNFACKMLMKTTPGVNFINILCAHFVPTFWHQKLQKMLA